MRNKQKIALILASVLVSGSILPCYGATTQEEISNAEKQKQSAESSLEDTRDRIDELESKKNESESYLTELNQQLAELTENLEKLQSDSEEKQEELEQIQQELETVKAQEAQQYEDMKLRIQYMYENSTSGYMELLFSSESFGDFLNRAQNMTEIAQYDRDMLDEYEETKKAVEAKEAEIREEQKEIARLQEESMVQQEAVQELYQATYNQLREYGESLSSAQSEEQELLREVNEQEERITQLLIRAKQEEAERRQREEAQRKAEEEQKRAEEARRAEAQRKAEAQKEAESQSGSGQSVDGQKETASGETDGGSRGEASKEDASDGASSESIDAGKGTYLGRFKLTAYCACEICCGSWAGGKTASGTTPAPGRTVAMAGVPFGTKLMINGVVYTVEDRGTQYGHVDIFQSSHSAALSFGVQYAEVYQVS